MQNVLSTVDLMSSVPTPEVLTPQESGVRNGTDRTRLFDGESAVMGEVERGDARRSARFRGVYCRSLRAALSVLGMFFVAACTDDERGNEPPPEAPDPTPAGLAVDGITGSSISTARNT